MPVTVTVKVPVDGLVKTVRTERLEPPAVSVILIWLNETPRPVGETRAVRAILPAKPLRLARLMENEPEEPAPIVSEEGLPETVKSTTLTLKVA